MAAGEAPVYVYGILSAGEHAPPAVPGVDSAAVRVVRHDGIGALVSDVEGGALAAAGAVRAHWKVLEQVAEHAAVLPVRFATVMKSDREVRERLLEPHAERLGRLLEELAGRVQLGVKGDYDEDRLLRDVVAGSAPVRELRARLRRVPPAAAYYERIRLGELVAAEVARRREQDARLALARLEPLAVETRSEPPGRAEGAFDLAFLVERARVDEFSAAVGRLREEIGDRIRVRYVGPLPAYSFADAALSEEDPAWA